MSGVLDSWVVAKEGKGVELCSEVNNKGDWHKDLVDNVKTYGRLNIPEYFAYAIGQNRLAAHRLRGPGLGTSASCRRPDAFPRRSWAWRWGFWRARSASFRATRSSSLIVS